MEIESKVVGLLKRFGIPVVVVIIIVAIVIIYSNYLSIRLTELQIKQAERDLQV